MVQDVSTIPGVSLELLRVVHSFCFVQFFEFMHSVSPTSFRHLAHLSKLTVNQSRSVTESLVDFLSDSVHRRRTSARFALVRDNS